MPSMHKYNHSRAVTWTAPTVAMEQRVAPFTLFLLVDQYNGLTGQPPNHVHCRLNNASPTHRHALAIQNMCTTSNSWQNWVELPISDVTANLRCDLAPGVDGPPGVDFS